jgi:hypothetical protein
VEKARNINRRCKCAVWANKHKIEHKSKVFKPEFGYNENCTF